MKPDDVAIIDHADLDRVSAEELVESGVRVVVNVSPSSTGQFPNLGPLTLLRGGVRLVDAPGAPLFEQLTDGEWVTVRGGAIFRNGDRLATGRVLDELELLHALDEQQARLADAISKFADNTMRYLREEGRLLAEGVDFPPLETRFRDRHCLVVARGPGHKHDLRIVRGYIRNFKPVLVGVDGGADALREAGYTPDVIVGDMDSVTDETLACGAELVVHAYPSSGDAPGAERAERLGLPYHAVPALGISEDVALLLAYEKGAELIVAVGTHFNLVEFLERNREGMSSTFMARLRVGEILVDAKGVSRLVSGRVGVWPLVAFARRRAGGDRRGDRGVAGPADVHPGARRAPAGGLRRRLILCVGRPDAALPAPADLPRCSQPPPRCEHTAQGRTHGIRDRAKTAPAARARRAVRAEASHEVLAPREDVWRFLAEPFHLADWWPTISAVRPDARGFREGARWEVVGPTSPTLFRKAGATGLAIVKTIELHERVVWSLTAERLDVEVRLGLARARSHARHGGGRGPLASRGAGATARPAQGSPPTGSTSSCRRRRRSTEEARA